MSREVLDIGEVRELVEENERLNAEVVALRSKLTETDKISRQAAALERELKRVNQKLSETRSNLADRGEEAATVEERVRVLEADLHAEKDRGDELTRKLAAAADDAAQLQAAEESCRRLEQKVDAQDDALRKAETEIERLREHERETRMLVQAIGELREALLSPRARPGNHPLARSGDDVLR
jgi:chromosome segregation ATPase